ncbi:MAG: hypothetical protein NPIRA02_01110 [Nitrospirales bacterium]|nr:MAG: hypothetical protein NPIRA02_01110 [Nitrospirales bacterium]
MRYTLGWPVCLNLIPTILTIIYGLREKGELNSEETITGERDENNLRNLISLA